MVEHPHRIQLHPWNAVCASNRDNGTRQYFPSHPYCRYAVISVFMGSVQGIMYVLEWQLFQRSREGYFGVLNKYQNNTGVSAETVRHESTYIILFLTRHDESINDYKNDKLYTSFPCLTRSVFVLLMTSQSIADDVTITRQLWCDQVNNDI